MDIKKLVDPIKITAIYSDSSTIFANTYTKNYELKKTYKKEMARTWQTLPKQLYANIFPITIQIAHENTNAIFPTLQVQFFMPAFSVYLFLAISVMIISTYIFIQKRNKEKIYFDTITILFVFGIIALIPTLIFKRQ